MRWDAVMFRYLVQTYSSSLHEFANRTVFGGPSHHKCRYILPSTKSTYASSMDGRTMAQSNLNLYTPLQNPDVQTIHAPPNGRIGAVFRSLNRPIPSDSLSHFKLMNAHHASTMKDLNESILSNANLQAKQPSALVRFAFHRISWIRNRIRFCCLSPNGSGSPYHWYPSSVSKGLCLPVHAAVLAMLGLVDAWSAKGWSKIMKGNSFGFLFDKKKKATRGHSAKRCFLKNHSSAPWWDKHKQTSRSRKIVKDRISTTKPERNLSFGFAQVHRL